MNINVSDVSNVRVNKHYDPNEGSGVRHLLINAPLHASRSGQYASENFKVLINRIHDLHKEGIIFFVDTRNDPHFELNGYSVCLKGLEFPDVGPEDINAKEKELAEGLIKSHLTFIGKFQGDIEEKKELEVTSGTTVKDYVEAEPNTVYIRFAIPKDAVLDDAKVDAFIDLLKKANAENAWIHFNDYIGGHRNHSAQLILLKAIYENAPNMSLKEIGDQLGEGGVPLMKMLESADDPKKLALKTIVDRFYDYCRERPEISWSLWNKQ